MSIGRSSYYPPRAGRRRWLRPFSLAIGRWLRWVPDATGMEVGRLNVPNSGIVASLLVPGFSFRRRERRVFLLVLVTYVCALLVFLAWIGERVASIAYVTMLSLHIISIADLIKQLVPDGGLKFRILSTMTAFLALHMFLYNFAQAGLGRFFVPVRVDGKVIVVRPCNLKSINSGDSVAYRIPRREWHESERWTPVRVKSGFGLDKVLATAGETVLFSSQHFSAGERTHPLLPYMPRGGQITVPPGGLFVWPGFTVQRINVSDEEVSQAFLRYAVISEENLVGKPFQHWFWRKQLL